MRTLQFAPWVLVARAYEVPCTIYGIFETTFKKKKRYKVRPLHAVDSSNMGIEGSTEGYAATVKLWGFTNLEKCENPEAVPV